MRVKPLLFLHIPKTGGTTIHKIIQDQYPNDLHELIVAVKLANEYKKMSHKKRAKITVIRGHFAYGLHEHVPGDSFYITMLRNPIERTISGYEYIINHKKHPFHQEMVKKGYSLIEFLKGGFWSNFDNTHVRFLSGKNNLAIGHVTKNELELAKKNLLLENVLFGITEKFDESILFFRHNLNWSMPYYIKANITAKRHVNRALITPEELEIIKQTVALDIELYNWCVQIFENNVRDIQEKIDAEKITLNQGNKKYKPVKVPYSVSVKKYLNRYF